MTVVLQGCQLLRAPWVSCCNLPPGHFLPWTHLGVTLKGTLKIQGLAVIARKHLLKSAFALQILCRWLISSRLMISFSFVFFFLSCLVKTIVCMGTRWQNVSYSILVHKILKQVLKDLAPGAKEKEVLSQKGMEFQNH